MHKSSIERKKKKKKEHDDFSSCSFLYFQVPSDYFWGFCKEQKQRPSIVRILPMIDSVLYVLYWFRIKIEGKRETSRKKSSVIHQNRLLKNISFHLNTTYSTEEEAKSDCGRGLDRKCSEEGVVGGESWKRVCWGESWPCSDSQRVFNI